MRDQCAAGRTKPSYCTIVMFIRSRGLFCIEYLIGGAEETERSLARSALSLWPSPRSLSPSSRSHGTPSHDRRSLHLA